MEWTALHKVLEEVEGRGGEGPAGGHNRQMVRCRGYNTTIPGMVVATATVPCQTPAYLPTARHHTPLSSLYHHGRSHPGASSMKCHQLAPCLNTGYVCSRLPTACQNTCFLCYQQMPNVLKQGFLQESVQCRTGAPRCFWGVFLEVMKIPQTKLPWNKKHPSWTHRKKTCHWPSHSWILTHWDIIQDTFTRWWLRRNYIPIFIVQDIFCSTWAPAQNFLSILIRSSLWWIHFQVLWNFNI